jgi:hypothetical protein
MSLEGYAYYSSTWDLCGIALDCMILLATTNIVWWFKLQQDTSSREKLGRGRERQVLEIQPQVGFTRAYVIYIKCIHQ